MNADPSAAFLLNIDSNMFNSIIIKTIYKLKRRWVTMKGEKGCIKCGSRDAGMKEVAMTGTGLSKMFDLQHNHFTVVYCKNCGYSEFYNKRSSTGGNILDLFFG